MAEQEEKKIIEYCRKTVKQNEKTTEKKELDHENDEHKYKLFNDSIHGSIQLNSLENAIINTPEYFRLKNIKQLGGACHVYPGATHTRFEHSIGVCYIAGEFVKHLNSKHRMPKPLISKTDEYCIRLAALCHDLGHGPLSHAFEDVAERMIETKSKEDKGLTKKRLRLHHEDISNLIFKKILLDHPRVRNIFLRFGLGENHVKKIENMINPDPEFKNPDTKEEDTEQFLYEIVANKSSGVDVDKWDYFARDCHYLGVTNEFDWRRCMTLSSIVKSKKEPYHQHIGFRSKELDNILSMFRVRCALHQKAYQHPVVNGIEIIFKQALVEAKDVPLIYTPEGKNLSMMEVVEKGCLEISSPADPPADLSGYICLSDTILDHILLSTEEIKEDKQLINAKDLIRRVMNRDLYVLLADIFFPIPPKECKEKFDKEVLREFNKKLDEENLGNYNEAVEIDLVTIKMASEKKDNPMGDIYFLPKGKERNDDTDNFPEGETKTLEDISDVNLPRVFAEYRVRLYLKKPGCVKKEDIKDLFEKWIKAKKEIITAAIKETATAPAI